VSVWRDLLRLTWLTGEDSRPAFWKLAFLFVSGLLAVVTALAYLSGGIVAALPWLFAWATLLLFGSFGLKGLSMWQKGKHTAGLTASVNTQVTGTLEGVMKEIRARRDDDAGVEPTP
jgi:hypothetical protein